MKNLPSYLLRRDSQVLYFRIAVPKDLQPIFKQREIKKSLDTQNLAYAYSVARLLAADAQKAFDECRDMAKKKNQQPTIYQFSLEFIEGGITKKITVQRDDPAEEAEIAARVLRELNVTSAAQPATTPATVTPLRTVISEYCAEIARENAWTEKSTHENQSILRSW